MDNDERLLGRSNKPRRDWLSLLGLRDKTLWDWTGLLIVPLFIAGATLVFSVSELQREERRVFTQQQVEADRVRQDVLQSYIQDMTGLMLDRGLATSKQNQPVRSIARSMTLTAARQLDGNRKGILLRFLHESNLIAAGESFREAGASFFEIDVAIISLSGADLSYADLSGADLSGADLRGAKLIGVNLGSAYMFGADLSDADLSGADLRSAVLLGANLSDADLSDAYLWKADLPVADLSGANLGSATLIDADLSHANLSGVNLFDADLRIANLSGTTINWTNGQLAQADSLVGATMPDGTIMTEEAWEEFKKRYGQ
jgi:uncharacterized protein YjbI with pentapeptide repeats